MSGAGTETATRSPAEIKITGDHPQLDFFKTLVLREGKGRRMYDNPFHFMKLWHFEIAQLFDPASLAELTHLREGKGAGIAHLSGLPIDMIIPSGSSALERNVDKTRISEAVILSMATLMNCYLYSKPMEQDGVIVHNVSPIKGKENVVSSVGRDPFYYHTEIAYADEVPRFLMLFCLEGDPTAKTSYFFIDQILKNIPDDIKTLMRLPIFKIGSVAGYTIEETITPLLSLDATGMETFRFYQLVSRIEPAFSEGEDYEKAITCLKFLEPHAKTIFPEVGAEPSISLQPAEALLFNNGWSRDRTAETGGDIKHHGVMHGRVGYISNPSRWLQRGYLFEMTRLEKEKANQGYANYLWELLTDPTVPAWMAARCLKTAIQQNSLYQTLSQKNPAAPRAWLFLNSVNSLSRLGRVKERYKTVVTDATEATYAAARIQRAYCFHRARTEASSWLSRLAHDAEFLADSARL